MFKNELLPNTVGHSDCSRRARCSGFSRVDRRPNRSARYAAIARGPHPDRRTVTTRRVFPSAPSTRDELLSSSGKNRAIKNHFTPAGPGHAQRVVNTLNGRVRAILTISNGCPYLPPPPYGVTVFRSTKQIRDVSAGEGAQRPFFTTSFWPAVASRSLSTPKLNPT